MHQAVVIERHELYLEWRVVYEYVDISNRIWYEYVSDMWYS